MKDSKNDLAAEIKDLQKEIARLSALLALRKLETRHPHLEKAVNEITRTINYIENEAEKLALLKQIKLGKCPAKDILKILGKVFLIGGVGYAIFEVFEEIAKKR